MAPRVMGMEYTITRGSSSDWERYRALRLEMLRDSPMAYGHRLVDVERWDDERWRVRAASNAMPDAAWSVAVAEDGTWLGQACARRFGDRLYVVEVYVTPSLRGSGVASDLLHEMRRWGRAHGFEELWLDVAEPQTAARRFYEREGFEATGVQTPHEHVPGVHEVEMVARLRG